MRVAGKSAIVTGAASGIGAATARTLAREGARVLLVDRDVARGEQLAERIRAGGAEAHFLAADMGDRFAIEGMIARAIEIFGRLDILHNNTAGAAVGPLGEITFEQWEDTLRLGLTSYWFAIRCALAHLIAAGGGSIVNTASISGLAADCGLGSYNTIKAAIVSLSRSVALDYARYNIRCNAVCPGIVFTPPYEKMRRSRPELIQRMSSSVPLGRFGTPDEIANVVLFLASDESSFVTGTTIVADGGRMAWTGTPSLFEGEPLPQGKP